MIPNTNALRSQLIWTHYRLLLSVEKDYPALRESDLEKALTSAGLNGFPDAKIPKAFKADPYRILIVAALPYTSSLKPMTRLSSKARRKHSAVHTAFLRRKC